MLHARFHPNADGAFEVECLNFIHFTFQTCYGEILVGGQHTVVHMLIFISVKDMMFVASLFVMLLWLTESHCSSTPSKPIKQRKREENNLTADRTDTLSI